MKTAIKIIGVGKTLIDHKDVIHKEYIQEVSGSAYKKIPGDVMLIDMAGHHDICLSFNKTYPNKKVVKWFVKELNAGRRVKYPKIKIKFI